MKITFNHSDSNVEYDKLHNITFTDLRVFLDKLFYSGRFNDKEKVMLNVAGTIMGEIERDKDKISFIDDTPVRIAGINNKIALIERRLDAFDEQIAHRTTQADTQSDILNNLRNKIESQGKVIQALNEEVQRLDKELKEDASYCRHLNGRINGICRTFDLDYNGNSDNKKYTATSKPVPKSLCVVRTKSNDAFVAAFRSPFDADRFCNQYVNQYVSEETFDTAFQEHLKVPSKVWVVINDTIGTIYGAFSTYEAAEKYWSESANCMIKELYVKGGLPQLEHKVPNKIWLVIDRDNCQIVKATTSQLQASRHSILKESYRLWGIDVEGDVSEGNGVKEVWIVRDEAKCISSVCFSRELAETETDRLNGSGEISYNITPFEVIY